MRNYIQIFIGHVNYGITNPFPPPDFTPLAPVHFVFGTIEELQESMKSFVDSLAQPPFGDVSTTVDGRFYWLMNKEHLVEVLSGFTGFWNFIGTTMFADESPRKTWSRGH